MQTDIKQTLSRLHFTQLPQFADFLLQQHLEPFCKYQLDLIKALDVPLLKYFEGFTDAQLLQISMQGTAELLTYLAQNNARQQIEKSIARWKKNAVPQIEKSAVAAEDITYFTFVRRKAFLHFLPFFCSGTAAMLQLIEEIDMFLLEAETASTNAHVELLKEEISDTTHLLQKINNTLPGAVYVFDVEHYKGVYSNNNLAGIIGYTQAELNALGENAVAQLIHPEDVQQLQQHLVAVRQSKDSEIKSFRYRVRGKDGLYHWVRNYEAVFKRNENGTVAETIGITLNVDKEQQLAAALEEREQQYKKAEALANIGHYNFDIVTQNIEWTDQLYVIYGLKPQSEAIQLERFLSFVHPDDQELVLAAKARLEKEKVINYTFRIRTATGEEKTIRSIAQMQFDENGTPVRIIGAEQDITEKQRLIEQLRQSEQLYKQAQSLTHVGNWTWDVVTGNVHWSDEVYRIYEIPAGEIMTYESVLAFVHPDDREKVIAHLQQAVDQQNTYDKYHRIVLRNGKVKTIHRRAEVEVDSAGKTLKLVGTTQDVTERQRLISQLEQSEKLYKQAQELAHLGNWTYDIATGKITWSDEIFKILHIAPQSINLDLDVLFSMMYPSETKEVSQAMKKAVVSGHPFEIYHRILRKDGAERILHVRGEAIKSADGKPTQIIGTAQDVTQQKATEQELRDNQTFIKKIADAAPSIIAMYNVNTGKYLFINEGLKKLLGYNTAQVMEEGVGFFAGIVHPDDLEIIMQKNAKVIEEFNQPDQKANNLTIAEFTYRMRHQNGTYRWFQTYGTIFDRNAEGRIEHVLNISLDITEQIEAERTIEAQEHFIRHIADASPTILYLFDVKENKFTYINQEIYYVLGYTVEEILEMGADVTRQLYHPDDFHLLPERRESKKGFQHTDSMMQYECRVRGKEVQWCWLLVREVIFEADENGNVLQILGAALDISKRKEMEKTLLQNSFLLEQSNASLEEFAYVASHDLKEPLRKISTFGDRLVTSQLDKLSDEGKTYLKKIVEASQRMQLMINDLLSVSMITGDRSFQNFSLQIILEEVLQTLEYKIEQKNATIESASLPDALIVPSQFRQLFQNLISNSLKFIRTDVQPHITIKYKYVPPHEVPHLEGAMRYLKLEFIDNGIGFEEEYAQKIFAIFQRLHGRSEYEGTGIGLAICKKIVEHHGGIIYAHGKLNEGSTFTVILPA